MQPRPLLPRRYAAYWVCQTKAEIKTATDKDTTLRCLRAAIRSNCWNGDILQPFRAIKHEISVDLTNNILLRGTRIIIPESLQRHVIKLAHKGHQGTAKTKALLLEYVWFPKLLSLENLFADHGFIILLGKFTYYCVYSHYRVYS